MMNRLWMLTVVVAAFLVAGWAPGGASGLSSECVQGQCSVAASSSWLAVALALGLAVFKRFYPQPALTLDPSRGVGAWRRFAAFLVDFSFVLLVVTPLVALALLVVEAIYTGTFQWSFARESTRPTDSVSFLLGALAGFAALFFYFYRHARLGRPTVGQSVLGYRIVPSEEGEPSYALRVLLSFVGLCMGPVSVLLSSWSSRQAYWWDSVTRTKAVPVVG